MSVFEILLIAVSLSFDVIVVSVGAGALNRITFTRSLRIALVFGAFHAVMPILGWLSGQLFSGYVAEYGNIIGFVLLLIIGLKMLKDAFGPEDVKDERGIMRIRTLLTLAFATSIDAFVIGITFNFVPVPLVFTVVSIGIITFIGSFAGLWIGKTSRHFLGTRIGVIGAAILIGMAFKILFF